MTHFTVGILIPSQELHRAEEFIATQMAPYDENTSVESYVCYDLKQAEANLTREIQDLERIIEARSPEYNLEGCRDLLQRLKQTTPEARYSAFLRSHTSFNDQGEPVSTYNSNSRWNWYVIGGRWNGWLYDRNTSGRSVAENSAPVTHILARKKFVYALITPDGAWHEQEKTRWWSVATGEKDDASWHAEQCQLLELYHDHHLVLVDAHI